MRNGIDWYLGASLYFDRIRGWPYCLLGGHGLVNFTETILSGLCTQRCACGYEFCQLVFMWRHN